MGNFWIFPKDANHNAFWHEVGNVKPEQVAYNTAYEVRITGLSQQRMAAMECAAWKRGWPTQREGEDYNRGMTLEAAKAAIMAKQRKILFLKGLPGSGKSTYAKHYLTEHPGTVRVSKDDLRALMHNGVYSKSNEKAVLAARDALLDQALSNGHDAICDDTNFHEKHLEAIKAIAEKRHATVEVKDFTDVPLEVCIERDLRRPNSVGERVIRQMHRQYVAPKSAKPVYDPALPDAVICDLDGTLALFGDANPYDRDFSKDEVNEAVKGLLKACPGNTRIIMLSGRKEQFKEQTRHWLKDNGVPFNLLYMRRDDDNRKDVIVKEELYNERIQGRYNVVAVFDDRLQVCRLWHRLWLPLFRVGDPDADF